MKTPTKGKDQLIQACHDACVDAKKTRDKYAVTKLAFLISAIVFAGIGVGICIYFFSSAKSFNLFSSLKAVCSFTLTYKLLQQYRNSEIDYKYYNSIYQDWKRRHIKLGILNDNLENIQVGHEMINIVFTKEEVSAGKKISTKKGSHLNLTN